MNLPKEFINRTKDIIPKYDDLDNLFKNNQKYTSIEEIINDQKD